MSNDGNRSTFPGLSLMVRSINTSIKSDVDAGTQNAATRQRISHFIDCVRIHNGRILRLISTVPAVVHLFRRRRDNTQRHQMAPVNHYQHPLWSRSWGIRHFSAFGSVRHF